MRTSALLAACLLGSASATASAAGTWQRSVALAQTPVPVFTAANATGALVAVWAQPQPCTPSAICARIMLRTGDATRHWQPATIVPSGPAITSVGATLSPAGEPTVIWAEQTSDSQTAIAQIFASTRHGTSWTAPTLLTSGRGFGTVRALSNPGGDSAAVWSISGVSGYSVPVIGATIAPAGQPWGASQAVASGADNPSYLSLAGAALARNGDLAIAYDNAIVGCGRVGCHTSDALSVTRLSPAHTPDTSPLLGGRLNNRHHALLAIDDAGRIGVTSTDDAGAITIFTQTGAGQAWSAGTTVSTDPNTTAAGFGTDGAGNATLLLLHATSTASRINALPGSLASNQWTTPATIATAHATISAVCYASSSTGQAVLAWVQTQTGGFANTRPSTTAPWNHPTHLDPVLGWTQTGPNTCLTDDNSNTIVSFGETNTAQPTNVTQFLKTYQP